MLSYTKNHYKKKTKKNRNSTQTQKPRQQSKYKSNKPNNKKQNSKHLSSTQSTASSTLPSTPSASQPSHFLQALQKKKKKIEQKLQLLKHKINNRDESKNLKEVLNKSNQKSLCSFFYFYLSICFLWFSFTATIQHINNIFLRVKGVRKIFFPNAQSI